MASSSSSKHINSPHPNHTKYDVFLSFRGEDTRHSFTDHLYTALKQAAIHTFRDDDEIRRGRDLEPELVKAIQTSKASIVVLSENYAKSKWCLEELWLILERKRKGDLFVLPVFYKVDPSDVRNRRKSFALEGSKWTEDDVTRWKSALNEVGNLTGIVASGSETKLIADIVDTVNNELDPKLLSTPAHLTGMETRAKEIDSWLKDEQSDTNIVAICGMGGSGKTTLAQYLYNSNKHNFESSSFLEEIGKHVKETSGLLGRQKQLLSDMLGGKNCMISSVAEGTAKINKVLQRKKVLIVLDDIDEHDELGALLGSDAIHTPSKIIITTRLLDIQSWFEPISWRCLVYKLELLNYDESLEVFNFYAFGSKFSLEGFSDLAIELTQYCGGNPLALKVLGSSLFVSAKDPQEINSIIESWTSRLNSLSSLNGDLDRNIQGVLQKSFDSLPLARYKELFLHIVVFFVGENEDYVVKIMEHDWYAKVGIRILINRCLLTVSPNKKLMIHQLLQDMGRAIAGEYSKDLTKHTRVWCSDEAYHVLRKGQGLETIEGLTLDARKVKKGTKALAIKTGWLAKMHKLKLLQLKYVKVSVHFKSIPELRWLCWHGCHMKTIPSGLFVSSFLVAIDMTRGNLENFEPPMVLNSLKVLNLTSCYNLVSIHKLYRLPNLETLILQWCTNLTHVCKTIEGLASLSLLNLAGCKKVWNASWNKRLKTLCIGGGSREHQLFSLPRSLKFLFLNECNLEYHNDLLFDGSLFGLSLRCNLFEFMPSKIDLKTLRVLNLDKCENLKSIPCLPSTLEELCIDWCKSLKRVTFQSARFRLKKFEYLGCMKLSEVQGLFKLVAIEELAEADLGYMKWIKAYQDQKVDLIGDVITEGRIWRIQMLYQYGIRNTYLQGIIDESMMASEYTSTDYFLSFRVSLYPNKHRIQGLNVSSLYRSSGFMNKDWPRLFIKISNRTKDVTWIYNPVVYCKPKVDEDVMWLSYWPIGNILDAGDEVSVSILVEDGMIVSRCGASLVYMDDDEVEQEENETMEMEEWIGGDLSEFEVSTGVYYLCRRDLFKFSTPDVIKSWFGDTIPYTELQGWRKSYEFAYVDGNSCMDLEDIPEIHRDALYKGIILGLRIGGSDDIRKIMEVVSRLVGVDLVFYKTEGERTALSVMGSVDSMAVEACVKEIVETAEIFVVNYDVSPPKKWEIYWWRLKLHFSKQFLL